MKSSSQPSLPFWLKGLWALLLISTLTFSAVFFSSFDILFQDFVTTGSRLLISNLLRIGVVGAMAITLLCAGSTTARLLMLELWSQTLSLPERLLLKFFLGSGCFTLIMFPIGLVGLYYRSTAVLLGGVFISLAIHDILQEGLLSFKQAKSWLMIKGAPTPKAQACLRWLLALSFASATLFFLLTRCLYPGETSNDSYEIYWPYQMQTVASHTLAPNDLWYMFCSFNGAGINFWSMLLTDLLGIQTVTYLFLLFGSLASFCVCRRLGLNVDWAAATTGVCLQCFAFTNPFWGAFQSHHIQTAAWLVAIVWTVLVFRSSGSGVSLKPALAAGVMLAALALVFPLFLIFLIPMLAFLSLIALWQRQGSSLRGWMLMLTMAGGAALALMLLNYAVTGMPLQNPTGPMWKLTNEERFSQWCSPYNVHYLFEGSEERTTSVSLGGLLSKPPGFWTRLLRLQSYGALANPWLLASLLALLIASFLRRRDHVLTWLDQSLPVTLPLGTCMLITNTSHPDSVYRNYGFVCFLIPPLLSSAWNCLTTLLPPTTHIPALSSLGLLALSYSPLFALKQRFGDYAKRHHPNRTSDFIQFALGQISVQEALRRGDGLWNPSQNARNAIGLEKQIFSFSHPAMIASYLFPGQGLLTEPSRYGFGGKWDKIVFEDAFTAKAELQKLGINYFLIDFSLPFFGAVPFSPLFEPSRLRDRFDLVTSIENSVLLTWKGSGQPLPETVVQALHQRVVVNRSLPDPHPDGVMSRLYLNTKAIYDYNRDKPLPVQRPPNLLKVKGWQ